MPDEELIPSKSAVKREMIALQKLGEELVGLSTRELQLVPIEDEKLRTAIEQARAIRSNSALRRQMQYIGKLMRRIDAAPIAAALEQLHLKHNGETDSFHRLEQWRDRLLAEGDSAMGEFIEEFPGADRQHVRQLLMQHRRETAAGKPPGAARKLFKYLRSITGESD